MIVKIQILTFYCIVGNCHEGHLSFVRHLDTAIKEVQTLKTCILIHILPVSSYVALGKSVSLS